MNFDPLQAVMHDTVASMRFPGPDYYEVLRWLHQELRPESYFEIGVFRGQSLMLAMPPTIAVGIDPCPEADLPWNTKTHLLAMSSAEFFARHTLAEFFGADRFSFAFVDGLHHFEQVLDDIFHLEAYARPDSVIAVHDTIPLDEKTSARDRCTKFHTGDVWKVVPFLKSCRPGLRLITVRTGPSGLTLIRGLDPSHAGSEEEFEALGRFRALPWEYYKEHRSEFLETIPNQRDAVVSWISNRTYDQHCNSRV